MVDNGAVLYPSEGTPNPIPQPAPSNAIANAPFEPISDKLLEELCSFRGDAMARYRFNNAWDVVLTVLGILLSIAIVACGFLQKPLVSAVLGATIGAIVTAQRAFPFGQRASFYRLLIGQSSNLITRSSQGLLAKSEIVNTLSSLRMDFAQQLPRGSSSQPPTAEPATQDSLKNNPASDSHQISASSSQSLKN